MKKTVAVLGFSIVATASIALDITVDEKRRAFASKVATPFQFALIGDAPYGVLPAEDYPPFDALTQDVNSTKGIKWVLHAGDIKSGGTHCSDEMFQDRLERFNKFDVPVILTPGDNEWTDCHRVNAGEYQPLERLAKLRDVFFPEPGKVTLGGESMMLKSQAHYAGYEEFPENTMWVKSRVVFSAVHVVGSQNGLKGFDPNSSAIRTIADDEEVARRTQAALAWLQEAFTKAEEMNSPGVFIMLHANPGLEIDISEVDRTGFNEILLSLEAHTKAFGKPVVLAHGDSHYMRIDKPALVDEPFLSNFTRVETFGASRVHWIKVTVNPRSENVFRFEQQIVDEQN